MNYQFLSKLNQDALTVVRTAIKEAGIAIHHRCGWATMKSELEKSKISDEPNFKESGLYQVLSGYETVVTRTAEAVEAAKLSSAEPEPLLQDKQTQATTIPTPSTQLEIDSVHLTEMEVVSDQPELVISVDEAVLAQEKLAVMVNKGVTRVGDKANFWRQLQRIVLTCNDPKQAEVQGAVYEVGNFTFGNIKKFIPFHQTEPFHVTRMMLKFLEDRTYNFVITVKRDGKDVKINKSAPMFNIQRLTALTAKEINEIALDQRLRAEKTQ